MRGIMVVDALGKLYHALVRQKVLPWLEQKSFLLNLEASRANNRLLLL